MLATNRDTEPVLGPVLAELIREPITSRLDLGGLAGEDVGRQLAAVTGAAVPPELAARVHERTGGNPFFVAELGRVLDRPDIPAIPASVRDAISRRMDRLSPQCRHQLRVASIVGREFSVAVVAAMIGRPVLSCLDPLDEAVAAGLIEPAPRVGQHRFTHALVRDAVEAGLPTSERVRLHRAAAEAIEGFYAGRLTPHLSDLARHWEAAAVAGDCEPAASWSERAADEAMRQLAYEEAARLFRQALDTGGNELDEPHRHRLLLSLAQALQHSAELTQAHDACHQAADIGRRLRRSDLIADAALAMDCVAVPTWDGPLRTLCAEALAGLGPQPTATRARVLARLAEADTYLGDLDGAAATSQQALAVAEQCGESNAVVAALRARQMVCSGPDGVAERAELASRLFGIGRELGSASIQIWAHSWRIDVCFARGDLAGAAAELEHLMWCVEQVGGPLARWHLLRFQGALAQANGRFTEARECAAAAFAVIAPIRHPAALPVLMSVLWAVDHHVGADPNAEQVLAVLRADPGSAPMPGHAFRIMDVLCPAMVLAEAGYVEEAGAKFRALGPVATWWTPPFYRLPLYAIGILVGILVDAPDEVAALRDILAAYRGCHVVAGAGVTHYLGPIELYLGKATGYLGDFDDAVDQLDAATDRCREIGAPGFVVEAQYELATVLIHQGDPDGRRRARSIVAECSRAAESLGMTPFCAGLARLAAVLDDRGSRSPLTRREDDVAACLARGLTNPQIAAELYISERTAQNHVQHILTKLSFATRSQIAVWVAAGEKNMSTPLE